MANDNNENETQPSGVGRDANPFEPKTPGYSDWNSGYDNFKDADEAVDRRRQTFLSGAGNSFTNPDLSQIYLAVRNSPFYLSPKYPSIKRTMTTAPTSQIMLFIEYSLSPASQHHDSNAG